MVTATSGWLFVLVEGGEVEIGVLAGVAVVGGVILVGGVNLVGAVNLAGGVVLIVGVDFGGGVTVIAGVAIPIVRLVAHNMAIMPGLMLLGFMVSASPFINFGDYF